MNKETISKAAECCLVLDRRDLRGIYAQLETEEDWHRLSQRVYVLNKTLGKRFGARFVIYREKSSLRVYVSSPEKFSGLLGVLRQGRGFVQKSLADCLESKTAEVTDRRSVPQRLQGAQAAQIKELLSRDLGLFASADLDSLLIDVAGPGGKSLLAQAAELLPGGAALLGESGSGKTAFLYSLLKNWERLGALSALSPVYIPAKHIHFEWGRFEILWETLPGVEPGMAERLEAGFAQGGLALLIDAVHENPGCVDFTNPAVQSFWQAAARNACVLAFSPRFHESHVQAGPLKSFFSGGLATIGLLPWGPSLYQALFDRLSAAYKRGASPQLSLLAGHLGKLSVEDWQRQSSLLKPTPLTGLAIANFFLGRQGARSPKDEYELLEHITGFALRHEGFKGSVAASETILGLLMRLAWQAFSEARGGRFSCVSTDDAGRVIRETYPALEERKSEVFHLLSQLPHLKYNPENGLFCMEPRFADFLAARHLLLGFLAGDVKRVREALQGSWENPRFSRLFYQGLAGLDRQEKQQFFEVSRTLYDASRKDGAGSADAAAELLAARLLEPLGLLNLSEATDFLWSVYNESKEGAEATLMSASIGLAWAGESDAIEVYTERLRKNRKASQFSLNWFLFDRRHDRSRRDIENFAPELVGRWETVCDWLLNALLRPEKEFSMLRLLHAHAFCNFLKTMGPGPFVARKEENGAGEAKVAERLKLAQKAAASLERDPRLKSWPALERQAAEFASLLAKSQFVVVRASPNGSVSVGKVREENVKESPALRRIS